METGKIFREIVDRELHDFSSEQSVAEVKRTIEQKTLSVADSLRGVMDDEVVNGILSEEKKWSDGIGYDASIRIDTISGSDGAAGMHHMSTRVTTLDVSALDPDRDKAYWNRVEVHEAEHGRQAQSFDVQTVEMGNGMEASLLNLMEWGAITASGQTDAELTPDYQEHKRAGDRVASSVGKERLMNALHEGELQKVQQEYRERMAANFALAA